MEPKSNNSVRSRKLGSDSFLNIRCIIDSLTSFILCFSCNVLPTIVLVRGLVINAIIISAGVLLYKVVTVSHNLSRGQKKTLCSY